MIAYRGRTLDKVKLPKKPIKEGYKVWVLGDGGYVYDWLWHSHVDGPEEVPKNGFNIDRVKSIELDICKKIHLTPIFALILRFI